MDPRIVIASERPTDHPRFRSEDGGTDVNEVLRFIYNPMEPHPDDPDGFSRWLTEPLVERKFNLNTCEVWSDVCPQHGTRVVEDGAVPEYSIEQILLRAPDGDWWMIVQRFYWECDSPCAGANCFKVPLTTVCRWFLEHSQLPPPDISSLVEDQVIGGLPRDEQSEQAATGLQAGSATPQDMVGGVNPQDTAHGDDFRSVRWCGQPYELTATQAACLNVLWEHWERGTPTVGEQTILDAADSSSNRLRDVFDKGNHPAWGTMIVEARKGAFRLQPKTIADGAA